MSKPTKGTALLPTATALRYSKGGSRLLDRNAAVILAAKNGHTPVVEQLIAAGAALDVQNNEG